ncbi:MAG: RNA polymerase sigma factor [Pseudomonadota bacterium]
MNAQIQAVDKDEIYEQRKREDIIDRQLLEAVARQRDEGAMESLYHRYQNRLIPFLHRLTSDDALIEETFNEVMMNVWRKAHQYKGQSMVSSWVFSIGYRVCLRTIKKAKRISEAEHQLLQHSDANESYNFDPVNHLKQALNQAMQQLKPNHRLVLELAYFEGLSIKEISVIAGRPENTIKTRLHHARLKMREVYGDSDGF